MARAGLMDCEVDTGTVFSSTPGILGRLSVTCTLSTLVLRCPLLGPLGRYLDWADLCDSARQTCSPSVCVF